MENQKRIIAINDISCFGKCSLTVALPILSAAGIETCVMPTAVLSTHTAFPGYTFHNLTRELLKTAKHWKSLDLSFDAVYTGYLGSKKQISAVEKIINMFPADFVLVDPVMGDNGVLYDGFDMSYARKMKKLLKKANVLVPNVTEACILTGIDYEKGIHSQEYIKTLCENLEKMCDAQIVVTGLNLSGSKVGTAVYDRGVLKIIEREKINAFYSGTGDVFASVLAAAYLSGADIYRASSIASDFVYECIKETRKTSGERNYGVNFEPCIKSLIETLKQK